MRHLSYKDNAEIRCYFALDQKAGCKSGTGLIRIIMKDGRRIAMKFLAVFTIALLAVPVPALAQQMGYGQAEFLNSCAMCHGPEGSGDGEFAINLSTQPADLTQLARKNGGEFPFAKVFGIIDGRFIVEGHEGRDMPRWSRLFLQEDLEAYSPDEAEAVTRERVRQLTLHVETLQR
jgi:mono/diheme cytochrome c family protein